MTCLPKGLRSPSLHILPESMVKMRLFPPCCVPAAPPDSGPSDTPSKPRSSVLDGGSCSKRSMEVPTAVQSDGTAGTRDSKQLPEHLTFVMFPQHPRPPVWVQMSPGEVVEGVLGSPTHTQCEKRRIREHVSMDGGGKRDCAAKQQAASGHGCAANSKESRALSSSLTPSKTCLMQLPLGTLGDTF